MMHVNLKRPGISVAALLAILAAGCSETPKNQLGANDPFPGQPSYDASGNYAGAYPPANSRLKFNKHKHKTPSGDSGFETVWDRLFALYALPEIDHYRVDRAVNWYLQHPASLAIIQQRAEPYLHHILEEVEAKNIPGELALLPVVESAFVAEAYSSADASGLWQFIPSTGEEYGLEQNDWYDGRRDVYASTQAATTYLKELSELFDGDWLLALASYNCGKNRVRKAVERNLERNLSADYWSLSLPQETMDYVPRLLAVARIFANAEAYNLHLQHIPNKPYFEAVDIKAPLDLHKAAQLANTPYDQFIKLNPGFNRSCTAPQGPHRLLVPVEQAENFKRNLAGLPFNERVDVNQFYRQPLVARSRPDYGKTEDKPLLLASKKNEPKTEARESKRDEVDGGSVSRYKVKPGETLSAIANRHHTTIAALRQFNDLPRDGGVRYGMMLKIPESAEAVADKIEMPVLASKAAKLPAGNGQFYAVKKGDTFWNISQRFAVSPKELAECNKITLKTALVPGRKLLIKNSSPQLASMSPIRLVYYKVGTGDSLTQIARKFNVQVNDLRKANADVLTKGLRAGQKLKIFVDGQPST